MLVLAIGGTVLLLALIWLLLGAPGVRTGGRLQLGDAFDAVKIALSVVAGAGGVVALVVAYRRQQLGESAHAREHGRALIDRFGSAAAQLGSEQPSVRMAGAYAMAQLADEWLPERQMCVDVLCGYLRMPHAAEPPADPAALAAWQRERAVRLTVLRLIAAHLRDSAAVSWRGYDLDFTGAVLDEADFRDVRFTGGHIVFIETVFTGHGHDQIVFDDAEFAEGCCVYFRLAEFRGGSVRFNRAVFSGGWVTFDSARFAGARVDFREAVFAAGEVLFEAAEFSGGCVDFAGAAFTGSLVNFGGRRLQSLYTTVPAARFAGGAVDLSRPADFRLPPRFGLGATPPGLRLPAGVDVADLP